MEDIKNKMLCHRPEALPGDNIFLSANLAIPARYSGSAIQTVLFSTFWLVGHANFFLKIATKTRVKRMLCLSTKLLYIFGLCTLRSGSKTNPGE